MDGEVVALDSEGRPSFAALQNAANGAVVYYVFDVLVLRGRDVMAEPLTTRRALLASDVLGHLREPVRDSPVLNAPLADLPAGCQGQRAGGPRGQACHQPLRAGPAFRRVAQAPR